MKNRFETRILPNERDTLAPDGSEIRLLPVLAGGGMAHCRLPPGRCSSAVAHRTVEEIWFVLSGAGEIWRQRGDTEDVVALRSGVSVTIPLGTRFQFRNTGAEPLDVLLMTMPPWPGLEEAVRVPDHWPTNG